MTLLARTDVIFPPIPVVDFTYLGFPLGLVALVVAVGATVGLVVFLRKRRIHGCLVAVAAVMLFMAVDCTAYFVGLREIGEKRRQRREERLHAPPTPPAPTATPSVEP
jgi:CDP-diglyceride synthetase